MTWVEIKDERTPGTVEAFTCKRKYTTQDISVPSYETYIGNEVDFLTVTGRTSQWFPGERQNPSIFGNGGVQNSLDNETGLPSSKCVAWRNSKVEEENERALKLEFGESFQVKVGYKSYDYETSPQPKYEGSGA